MFTGIVEEIGTILRVDRGVSSAALLIKANVVTEDLKIGDSVAVNGVCLTVTSLNASGFTADVMHETLNRSSLEKLKNGSRVNLERAMAANGRFGGHIVAGHVDGTGIIKAIKKDDNAVWYTVSAPTQILRYIVEKGSITIDGISLTVAGLDSDSFSISAIPHTVAVTILADKKVGDVVNLENDIIGKYVERFMTAAPVISGAESERNRSSSGLTEDFLMKYGFK